MYPRVFTSSCADSLTRQRNCDMDPSSTSNQEQWFPLLKLPSELRNVVYRHALGHALPRTILPRWMEGLQGLHEYTVDCPVATERLAASSFVNLQLSCRQLYHEVSHILYEDCQFSFVIAPSHASFLDACLISWHSTLDIQDKSYTHRITNIVLKANWDCYDWAAIRNFSWSNWKHITHMVCCALLGFPSLQRITLDWRVPNPCGSLQQTGQQWSSISPYFEYLQANLPRLVIEVLAWQAIPGSIPLQYRKIRTTLQTYNRQLQSLETLQHIPVFLPSIRMSHYRWPPLFGLRNPFYRSPDTSNRLPQRPIVSPWGFYAIHNGEILAFSDGSPLLLTPCRNL